MPHPEFEKHVKRVLPESKARHLLEIAETLSTKVSYECSRFYQISLTL